MGRLRGGYDFAIQNVFPRDAWASIPGFAGGSSMPLQETPHGVPPRGVSTVGRLVTGPGGARRSRQRGLEGRSGLRRPFEPEQEPREPGRKPVKPFGKPVKPFGKQTDPFGKQTDPSGKQADPFGKQPARNGKQADPSGKQTDPWGKQADPQGGFFWGFCSRPVPESRRAVRSPNPCRLHGAPAPAAGGRQGCRRSQRRYA